MDAIVRINVGSDRLSSWGITANDYEMDGVQVDFQDLLVNVSKKRAVTVEGEIVPLSTRIRSRNALMDILGEALSTLSGAQAAFASDDAGSKTTSVTLSANAVKALKACGKSYNAGTQDLSKSTVEELVQLVKSKIDSCNNQSQTDMTRLQSLVDRRDQSFSSATELMTNVSDTRGNLISNIQ